MLALTMQPDLRGISPQGAVRQQALVNWQATGWPGPRVEAWRYTKLDKFIAREMQPATSVQPLDQPDIPVPEGAVILRFTNGILDRDCLDRLPVNVRASDLGDDEAALAQLQSIAPDNHPVSTLSLAAMTSGLLLDITGEVDTPIMMQFIGDDAGLSAHPVIMIRLASGAKAVMAEWHASHLALSAPLIGIELGAGARLDMAKIQAENDTNAHIAATGVVIGENAVLAGFTLSMGAQLARLETHVKMAGEGGDCQLSAVYLGSGNQHHDVTTYMDHAVGHCNSNQIIRGVLDDHARGVYQGKVHVAQDAQKTDGQQMSRALLLSRKAEADAKPELEIYADDVICAHGATVGELDDTQLFYLTSRGISYTTARAMLIEAFLLDAIDTVENEVLNGLLRPAAEAWMAREAAKER